MTLIALTKAATRQSRQGCADIVRCLLSNSSSQVSVSAKSSSLPLLSSGLSSQAKGSLRYVSYKVSSPTLLRDRDDKMELATSVQDTSANGWGSHSIDQSSEPGSKAFVECDRAALIDLFNEYAKNCDVEGCHLDRDGLKEILRSVGENADDDTVDHLFRLADDSGDDLIQLDVSSFLTTPRIGLPSPGAGRPFNVLDVHFGAHNRLYFLGRFLYCDFQIRQRTNAPPGILACIRCNFG